MLFKGLLATSLSGSIDGITASHNAGGAYFRARTVPTDPNSPAQQAVKAAMGTLSNRWEAVLTVAQRAAWASYAANVPLTNRLGDPINVSGLAMYVRSNLPRIVADPGLLALPIVDDGPTTFTLGQTPTNLVPTPAAAASTISVAFTDVLGQNAWIGEDEAALIVQASRAQNDTIEFFKAPFRFATAFLGNTAIPLTSPQVATNGFGEVYVAGQKVFIRARATFADGRLSDSVIAAGIAV